MITRRAGAVPRAVVGKSVDIMMSCAHHHDVRTTLTIDDDIATRLDQLSRKTGASFKEIVNDTLRKGLEKRPPTPAPFRIKTRDLGLRKGLQIDNIADLMEQLDGPSYK